MPKLSGKTKLVREAARQAAEEMAAEGDRSILDAAEKLAGEVKQMSVDGALEVLFCAAIHEMRCSGKAAEVESLERALDRYDRETGDD